MVKNPPVNTGYTGSNPGPGRSRVPRGSQACMPQLLKPTSPRAHGLQQGRPPQWEAHVPQLESSPWRPQPQKHQHTKSSQKKRKKKLKKKNFAGKGGQKT